jgi:hypothetical protein
VEKRTNFSQVQVKKFKLNTIAQERMRSRIAGYSAFIYPYPAGYQIWLAEYRILKIVGHPINFIAKINALTVPVAIRQAGYETYP